MQRVVAVMAVRNERPYLGNCLDHLIDHGVSYFILDNESDDGGLDLLRQPRYARNLVGLATHPFDGTFDWRGLLSRLDDLVPQLDADWAILTSPDEILHPYTEESLTEAITRLDAAGFDVVNFDEFVFLPIDADYVPGRAGPQPLHLYYFFEPAPRRLMRARRVSLELGWLKSGGHRLKGKAKLADETFALRHYIFRSQEHALAKYATRVFRDDELKHGWHGNRYRKPADRFLFPPSAMLERLADPGSRQLSRQRPRRRHYWEWD